MKKKNGINSPHLRIMQGVWVLFIYVICCFYFTKGIFTSRSCIYESGPTKAISDHLATASTCFICSFLAAAFKDTLQIEKSLVALQNLQSCLDGKNCILTGLVLVWNNYN